MYLSNPCDALGRVHAYSPLWLTIVPRFLDTSATVWVELALDLVFILSLAVVFRPATGGEILVMGLVALSPTTVYALERANNDLIVFALILGGCVLGRASRPWRLGAYGLYLLAGLLKYYPLVLLVLLARERRRDALATAAAAVSIVLLFVVCDHAELGRALAKIPSPASYYADLFSALNLPFGFAEAIAGDRLRLAIAVPLLTIVAAIAVARIWRLLRLLGSTAIDPDIFETQCLIAGGLVLVTCFFIGRNIDYRGIYFVLVVPGLVRLHQAAEDSGTRRLLAQMIATALFVCWEELFRRVVFTAAEAFAGTGLRPRVEVLFWIGRELAWWWLIAGLAAVVLACLRLLPLIEDCPAALRRLAAIGQGEQCRPGGRADRHARR